MSKFAIIIYLLDQDDKFLRAILFEISGHNSKNVLFSCTAYFVLIAGNITRICNLRLGSEKTERRQWT